MIKLKRLMLVIIATILLTACTPTSSDKVFTIVSGSENQTLESIVQAWGKENRVNVSIVYKGSVEIASILQTGGVGYDAVWPANSLWINLGDTGKITRDSQSIMRSPVILGVKKSIAQKLGWVDNTNVTVQDLLAAMQDGNLRLMMTNPSQSNSGASAYFAFLYAFSGSPDVISSADLNKNDVQSQVKNLLSLVNRTSESSGFLKDTFVANYDKYDAMMNYESLIIEADQTLVAQGQEPLYAVYLSNGMAIADSPFAYVDHGNATKRDQFDSLQKYLLSDKVQQQLLEKGRRTGIVGLNVSNANSAIFNPDWGIDVSRTLSPIRYPNSDVIMQALNLYQDVLRKPSLTVFCLDFSGSMGDNGEEELKAAMRLLLVQSEARKSLLQATSDDLTIILPFSDYVWPEMSVIGAAGLDQIYDDINALNPRGGTGIYSCLIAALDAITLNGIGGRNPAIIVMTDGRSNAGSSFDDFVAAYNQFTTKTGEFVPVYAITFGSADTRQLEQITLATGGTIYNGTKDLVTAFKKAKGNN